MILQKTPIFNQTNHESCIVDLTSLSENHILVLYYNIQRLLIDPNEISLDLLLEDNSFQVSQLINQQMFITQKTEKKIEYDKMLELIEHLPQKIQNKIKRFYRWTNENEISVG